MPTQAALLGSLTIPGEPVYLHNAREFVARTLGTSYACSDTAILLTSELVTNSVQHSNSRRPGGTVAVTVVSVPDGIRVEVIDEGGTTVPTMLAGQAEPPDLTESGRGLQLVEIMSAQWSYYRDSAGTVTWFELTEPPNELDHASLRR
jgi:anti-sigma regulatory factor (Ser/Thr protein kinase)